MSNLEQMREGWDRYACAYDEVITPLTMRAAMDALDLAGVRPGMRLLDVASGGGALSIPAARLGAEVVAVDYAPAMVDLLRSRAREMGLTNLTAQPGDGTELELDDDSFDIACSQLGIMLFPDRAAGLRELARVTKPSGKGVIVAFGPPERVHLFSLFFRALSEGGVEVSPEASPLFCYRDLEVLRKELEEAGYRNVQLETVTHRFEVESPDQFWSTMVASAPAVAGIVAGMTEDQRIVARAALGDILQREYGTGSATLPVDFHVGIGTKR